LLVSVSLAGILALVYFGMSAASQAEGTDDAPIWLGGAQLNLQKEAALSTVPSSLNGNIDCQYQDESNCVVPTSYGMADSSSEVLLNHTSKYYPVYTQVDGQRHFLAVPNSDTAISYSPTPAFGSYFYFNHNFSASYNITQVNTPSGISWEYHINRPPDGVLQDQNGQLLPADYDSMSFSANGQWMVVTAPDNSTLRVNLETFQVTPFATGFNYRIGSNPAPQTAITNDGRYAVVASKNFGFFKIYDLNTCDNTIVNGFYSCQSRDLQTFSQQQITDFINASIIRFIGNDTLGIYISSGHPNNPTVAKYILNTGLGSFHQADYLALGDSYISGEGAFDYQTGTDTNNNQCHVSLIAYPYLLGLSLDYNSYHSVACSGALTRDVLNTSLDYEGQTKSKAKRRSLSDSQLSSIKSNFLPGYIDQLDFVSQYQPKVITLSVGGNDLGFSQILKQCVEPWQSNTCYNTYEDRLELVQEINNSVFPKLVNTYQQIKNAGAPDARIYIIGYPQIAKPGGDCGDNVHLDAQEVRFSAQLISYLDSVVQAAASKAGVAYVDTQHALDGHRLCEASSKYSAGVNGLTAGNDMPGLLGGPIANESYHPTFIGHQLLEQAILNATNNLTQPMPSASDLAASPLGSSSLDILNLDRVNRAVNTTEYDSEISEDVMYRGTQSVISIDGIDHSLASTSTMQAVLHSDPIQLGAFITDLEGNLNAQIVIPDSVSAGYHTLHFYGLSSINQPVDIYKTVYIAASITDLDGDGIVDSQESCVGIPVSGHDIDQDGIDDACDGFINAQPATIANTTNTPADTDDSQILASHSNTKTSQSAPQVLAADESNQPNSSSETIKTPTGQNLRLSTVYVIGFGLAAAITAALAYASKD